MAMVAARVAGKAARERERQRLIKDSRVANSVPESRIRIVRGKSGHA
jgi:hypothetical protein